MVATFLKQVPIFSELSEDDIDFLCSMVEIEFIRKGEILFNEGDVADKAYVIKNGQLEVLKSSGERQVLLAVRSTGEFIGEIALFEETTRTASLKARTDTALISIGKDMITNLLEKSSHASRVMFSTILARLRSRQSLLQQSEKMAQLGTLSAGMAHELNNPAAAVARGTEQLIESIQKYTETHKVLYTHDLTETQRVALKKIENLAKSNATHPPEMDALAKSDKEYEMEDFLEENDIENAYEFAPALVSTGIEISVLQDLIEKFDAGKIPHLIQHLNQIYQVNSLMFEIKNGSERISDIVKALKQYSYLDQAPVQQIDVHEGIDNTLLILRNKLKYGISVKKDYAENLPKIQGYGSELNQVWTNLIDNAADALEGKGEIRIRTANKDSYIIVEIADNGPGISEDKKDKIFEPFFTTKAPGKGTGLGLDISYNIIVGKHKGEIKLFSKPGNTCFQVILPIKLEGDPLSAIPIDTLMRPDDKKLLEILDTQRNIAVVGITDNQNRPGYSVPTFLDGKGYNIIGVNPNISEWKDKKVYYTLHDIPQQVDTVLVFRQSQYVPNIVEDAINIGAKTVWMQEGIIHDEAAGTANGAGLDVIMDTCMRLTYKRLKPKD